MIRTHHCRTHVKRDSLELSLNKIVASYKTKLLKIEISDYPYIYIYKMLN